MANTTQKQPTNSKIVPIGFGQPFAGLVSQGPDESQYESFRTPTSDGSGEEFFFRPNGKGADQHPDSFRYSRNVTFTPVTKPGLFGGAPVQQTVGNSTPFGGISKDKDVKLYNRNVTFTKAGRKEGISFTGRKGPERAKRANAEATRGSKPSKGKKTNIGNRSSSTILTGSRGALGKGSTSSKTLLGA